jgi:hypothetical protein
VLISILSCCTLFVDANRASRLVLLSTTSSLMLPIVLLSVPLVVAAAVSDDSLCFGPQSLAVQERDVAPRSWAREI